MRMEIDAHFRTVRTMCSAPVDPEWVLKAIASGADGMIVPRRAFRDGAITRSGTFAPGNE